MGSIPTSVLTTGSAPIGLGCVISAQTLTVGGNLSMTANVSQPVGIDANVKLTEVGRATKQADVPAMKKVEGADRQDAHDNASFTHSRMLATRSTCIVACMIRGRSGAGECQAGDPAGP